MRYHPDGFCPVEIRPFLVLRNDPFYYFLDSSPLIQFAWRLSKTILSSADSHYETKVQRHLTAGPIPNCSLSGTTIAIGKILKIVE